MSSGAKWPCTMCTYENWPAAFTCTLCGTPRSPSLIEDEMQRLQLSTNSSEQLTSDRLGSASESSRLTKCLYCTYLNQPQNLKCEQCFQVLQDPSKVNSQSYKPASSTCTPTKLSSGLNTEKWSCSQCTYENWPKSKHCVMCYAPKPLICPELCDEVDSKETISASIPSNSSETAGKRSNLSLNSRDRLWLSACVAVANGEVSPVERYISTSGRMERRLTKQECRYLNHFLTSSASTDNPPVPTPSTSDENTKLVDDNPQFDGACASQTLQNSDWDTTCGPTNTESMSPNFGLKFRSGWTLVDMAILFGRSDLISLFITRSGLQATSAAISLSQSGKTTSLTSNNRCGNPNHPSTETPSQTKQSNQTTKKSVSHIQQIMARFPTMLNRTNVTRSKWTPCQASSTIASELRDLLAKSVRRRRDNFPCAYFSEWATFALPYSITKLPAQVKQILFSELCDTQAQTELEDDAKAINWWFIPGQKQSSRLFALWNRTAGDCLLDSALQACWGVFDRENCLRRTLAETLRSCEASFYPRWRDYEALQAASHYILDEDQCRRDWDNVLAAACQPREALEQIHIFALCHILRRPIIVYGVKYIKNYRDEPIGIANFQGLYLPLLWEKNVCSPNPIVLGYTRGHFSALVPMEPHPVTPLSTNETNFEPQLTSGTSLYSSPHTSSSTPSRKHSPTPVEDPTNNPTSIPVTGSSLSSPISDVQLVTSVDSISSSNTPLSGNQHQNAFIYLPLVDRQGAMLPIHFTTEKEAKLSHTLLQDWLDVVCTRRGVFLARLRLYPKHVLVDRMVEEWLDSYRSLAKLANICATGNSNSQAFRESEPASSSSSNSSSASSTSNSSDTDQPETSKVITCDIRGPSP